MLCNSRKHVAVTIKDVLCLIGGNGSVKNNTSTFRIVFNSQNTQHWIIFNNDQYEETVAYNDILGRIEKDKQDEHIWKFKKNIGHQGPLK